MLLFVNISDVLRLSSARLLSLQSSRQRVSLHLDSGDVDTRCSSSLEEAAAIQTGRRHLFSASFFNVHCLPCVLVRPSRDAHLLLRAAHTIHSKGRPTLPAVPTRVRATVPFRTASLFLCLSRSSRLCTRSRGQSSREAIRCLRLPRAYCASPHLATRSATLRLDLYGHTMRPVANHGQQRQRRRARQGGR